MRAPDPAFRAWFDAARAVPIEQVVAERGIVLRGRIEREGACPECGGGRGANRFSINTRKQVFQCRKGCGSGSVIDLVMMLDRCDEKTAAQTLTGRPPPSGADAAMSAQALAEIAAEREAKRIRAEREAAAFRERERRRLRGWWKAAQSAPGSDVEAYLARRRVSLPPGARLRFNPAMPMFASGAANAVAIGEGPAMLAGIRGVDGRFAGLHITWIDLAAADGKARFADADGVLEPAKKVRGSQVGGHIFLGGSDDPGRLFIGEGIETTLSVRDALIEAGTLRPGDAFWSGINLGNIGGPHADTVPHPTLKTPAGRVQMVPGPVPAPGGIPMPETVCEIVILGDGDSDPFTTRTAYERAAARWARPTRAVRLAMAPPDMDFNKLRGGEG